MSFAPQSGNDGSILIGDFEMCLYSWDYDFHIKVMEAVSYTVPDWVPVATGKKRARMNCVGFWNSAFNPFGNAIKLGSIWSVRLVINGSDYATCGQACIAHYHVLSNTDDMVIYSVDIIPNGEFDDFSHELA